MFAISNYNINLKIKKMAKLSTEKKGELINKIIGVLKEESFLLGKNFDGSKTFFDLIFVSDNDLLKIAKASNVI